MVAAVLFCFWVLRVGTQKNKIVVVRGGGSWYLGRVSVFLLLYLKMGCLRGMLLGTAASRILHCG